MRTRIFYLLTLVVLVVVGLVYMLNNFFFVSKADFYTDHRFIINNSTASTKELHEEVILEDEGTTIYAPLELLIEEFNVKGDYDIENNIAIITTLDKVIRFYGEDIVKVNHKEAKDIPSMVLKEEKVYIPISHVGEYLNIESEYKPETNGTILTNLSIDRKFLEISEETGRLRADNKLFSQVITTIPKGEELQLINNDKKWLKVLSKEGYIGYISKNSVITGEEVKGVEILDKPSLWPKEAGKILLAWEHVHSKNPDTSKIGELKGLNVISPTWMELKNDTGEIEHKIDSDYIKWAKDRNYQIWALFDNQFNPDLTHAFLSNPISRETTIIKLLNLIKEYDMNGINIDFENVYLEDKDKLVQFVRELVPVFHENQLVVSMDVTTKSLSENWSMFYDRKALGEVVDYINIMAYDEHWGSSPISGSVASIGWVEKGIKGILEDVPPEKILLGMPLYTRVWTETPTKEGVEVKSRAVTMDTVNTLIDKYNLEKLWNEDAGQNYVEYKKGKQTNKIWIEDGASIQLKYDLIHKYNLAGAALWRRGFETPDIWEVLDSSQNIQK